MNLIGDDIRTIKTNAEVLLNACKDIGLAVTTRISIGSNLYDSMKTFWYLGPLLKNQRSIHEKVKRRFKVKHWYYYSLQ